MPKPSRCQLLVGEIALLGWCIALIAAELRCSLVNCVARWW
jgi:hypothetical protein